MGDGSTRAALPPTPPGGATERAPPARATPCAGGASPSDQVSPSGTRQPPPRAASPSAGATADDVSPAGSRSPAAGLAVTGGRSPPGWRPETSLAPSLTALTA